jgi:hypothetical protein
LQWGGGVFLGDVKPPGLDIWWSIDRVDTCIFEGRLSFFRVIMAFGIVPLV